MGACLSQSEEAQLKDKDETLDQTHPSCLERREQEIQTIFILNLTRATVQNTITSFPGLPTITSTTSHMHYA